ncbi:hypothetical protein [Desertibacillus haloalkaliphilus]|uniref:hypothetical protein n=1 Tax=Desertibacillus haloalkaliphilus TaxID=1328930 RepID=UPI001C276C14|nr:hypothetical protein [Desertibacillus haloalkaliphilus]MBU8907823.1 hypothetical protein [Desertibacillus haloalkaliphilus]
MKKLLLISVIIAIVIVAFFIKITPTAPDQTRMIIDHTHHVYVSPPCFDQAELTNYLEETTLEKALATGYEPESACTEASLVGEPRSIAIALFEKVGLVEPNWGRDGSWN